MDGRRRRANDFTCSLTSFHQTTNNEGQSQAVQQSQTYSEDSLDTTSIKNRQCENDQYNYLRNESRASIILAGNLANQQCTLNQIAEENITFNNQQSLLRDTYGTSDDTSYLSIKPDLNKCINLFHNEHLNKEYDTCGEYLDVSMLSDTKINKNVIDPYHLNKNKSMKGQHDLIKDRPRSLSSSSLKNIAIPNKELTRSKSYNMLISKKRDTNYNIKDCQFSLAPTEVPTVTKISNHEKVETVSPSIIVLSLKSSTVPNKEDKCHSTIKDQKYDSTNSERSLKDEFEDSEFESLRAFLHSLGDQQPLKEATMQGCLKHMSINFYESPKTFTERLLTIIEESVINNDSCAPLEYPEVSLCRLTEELRKICKFIEDETIPEWPQSPGMSTSIYTRKSSSRKSPGVLTTPISPRCNNKSPKKICRRISKNGMKNPLNDSTSTFESLEAYCNKLYPNEHKAFIIEKKNRLESPSRNIDTILRTCEQQLASLNSPNVREQLKKAEIRTPDITGQCNKVPEKRNLHKTDSKSVPDIIKQRTGRSKHEMIETDDLENSLIYEIAKKRQRCLDTAKVMMEIDANSESTTAQEIPTIIINDFSPTVNDSKFMETLMSVKKYQAYLEEHKPLLNLFQQIDSCGSRCQDERNVRTKKMFDKDFGTRNAATLRNDKAKLIPEFSTMRKKNVSPTLTKQKTPKDKTNKIRISKPKLFITPGKTPVNKSRKPKRTYFTKTPETKGEKEPNINSHIKNIYRQIGNYDHVVSPVGMYIRGTDPHLMKNLRPKTDEMLLTPRKKQTMLSPNPKPEMKFRLSPKQLNEELIETAGDENVADNFLHPKVHYKLPSHVRTIKEAENRKDGNRMNELLRSVQDKVVIRHEGRTKSVQTDHLEQPEIHYDSAEESVHIEQTARKTYFSRKQKDYQLIL